jgi:hypothetical protein
LNLNFSSKDFIPLAEGTDLFKSVINDYFELGKGTVDLSLTYQVLTSSTAFLGVHKNDPD